MSGDADLVLWQFIRAAGLVSYILLTASVLAGISLKSRLLDGTINRPWVYEAHRSTTLAALAVLGFHVALVLLNRHVPFSLAAVVVPFVSGWRPLPTALGILALYLAVSLTATTYGQRRIGYRTWRLFHYLGFAAWGIALAHGLTAGTDSGLRAVDALYWGSAAAVLSSQPTGCSSPCRPRRDRSHFSRTPAGGRP